MAATPLAAPVEPSALLTEAVTVPGSISAAFHAFRNFSVGNMLLAAWQCSMRGIPLGPIATYKRWSELGRQVRKGENSLILCQPRTWVSNKVDANGEENKALRTAFLYRKGWFVLAQTDGEATPPLADIPTWNRELAVVTLGKVWEKTFTYPDGNTLGVAYPSENRFQISPLADDPDGTFFHELAHTLLHKEENRVVDGSTLSRNLGEVEAESVAYILGNILGVGNPETSRGYIQHWLRGNEVPNENARRIFSCVDKILRAGRPDEKTEEETND